MYVKILIPCPETSRTRHVQYCRRRASRQGPKRQKACHSCRTIKTKCNFGRPCARCVARDITCSYGADQSMTPRQPLTGRHDENQSPVSIPRGAEVDVLYQDFSGPSDPLVLPGSGPVTQSHDYQLGANNALDFPETAQTMIPLEWDELDFGLKVSEDLAFDPIDPFLATGDGSGLRPQSDVSVPILTPRGSSSAPETISSTGPDVLSLVSDPSYAARQLEPPRAGGISNGCRRFVMSIMRTYPRMMTRPDNLPPFVHPVACGLYFDHRDGTKKNQGSAHHHLLGHLVACQSIAHVFVSRGPNTEGFVWRTIENERRTILKEVSGRFQLPIDSPLPRVQRPIFTMLIVVPIYRSIHTLEGN